MRSSGNGDSQWHPLRQWAGTDQSAFSSLVCRTADRVNTHSAGETDAECARRELSRTAAGRMLVGELVSKPVRCATKDHVVADRVQRSKATQQLGISDAEGVCYSDESGWGRLRFTGSAGPSRKPGVGNCRMIPCAKSGGRSVRTGISWADVYLCRETIFHKHFVGYLYISYLDQFTRSDCLEQRDISLN